VSWSAGQYVKFEDERTRPVRDLLSAVPTQAPRRAIDLGCGPGNSTEVLAARFPEAEVSGLDSSEEMVRAARQRLPHVSFEVGDIDTWGLTQREAWNVMLANAVLQWLPDHWSTLPRLVQKLAPGGSLAVQMPDNLAEPAHVVMRQVARAGPWADKLGEALAGRTDLPSPGAYYDLLRPDCQRVDVWRTVYHHALPGIDAVVEWFKGSALGPFLKPLEEDERAAFLERYRDGIAAAYPPQSDGVVLLPFPRLFLVATRSSS
jgi:trans-aconitate 2-methyltransferase